MEARNLPPPRAPGGPAGLDSPLDLELAGLHSKQATWRRAGTLVALIAAPWAVVGGGVAALLVLL